MKSKVEDLHTPYTWSTTHTPQPDVGISDHTAAAERGPFFSQRSSVGLDYSWSHIARVGVSVIQQYAGKQAGILPMMESPSPRS